MRKNKKYLYYQRPDQRETENEIVKRMCALLAGLF